MDERGFYLTTAIPYVNAKPHIGHAQECVIADVLHRYHEIMGNRVFFVSGPDENALKCVQAAEREGLGVAEFLDKYSSLFRDFFRHMRVKIDVFRRGSDQSQHWPGVQRLWRRCVRSGDIYKKKYIGLYCVGCESFKTETDLINGLCPDHSVAPERIAEENYFFRLSRYRKRLEHLIVSGKLTIVPEKRKREILSFLRP